MKEKSKNDSSLSRTLLGHRVHAAVKKTKPVSSHNNDPEKRTSTAKALQNATL